MNRRNITILTVLLGAAVSFWLSGCMPDTEIGGVEIPNALPNTEISGNPPNLLESGFAVDFHWTGFDPDNRVIGYQWKISDNGLDGINVADTLTFDPSTGDTLNPWHFTTSTDTTFLVTADLPDFPSDPDGYARSYQVHTLFVRAVDEAGGVDNTPAHLSFTSTTILPSIRVTVPERLVGQNEPKGLPPSVTFGWDGEDPDFDEGLPTHVRYMWKEAQTEGQGTINSQSSFEDNMDELVDFADSLWGPWIEYDPNPAGRRVTFPDRPFDIQRRWLFAIQARDTAGAVSIDRDYGVNVMHVKIVQNLSPSLTVYEPFLGTDNVFFTNQLRNYEIAAGQSLNFSWAATAESYAGEIVSYRYGWDVVDPTDPDDPGWAVPAGLGPDNLRCEPTSFESGLHSLIVQVLDNSGLESRLRIVLDVVPIPDLEQQFPLLLIDDVDDSDSQRWPSVAGQAQDTDILRDAFWESIAQRVNGWFSHLHWFDTETHAQAITYRMAVNYRVLLWTSKYVQAPVNKVSADFRPEGGCTGDQLNWLTTYQQRAGNLFFVSSRAMDQFITEDDSYMSPIIFDTYEEVLNINNVPYVVGFGECELPDGSEERRGLTRYPYQIIGLSMIDAVSPTYHIYNRIQIGFMDRKAQCVGAKGLRLNTDFRQSYLPDGGIQDVIMTNTEIDWQDNDPDYYSNLANPWAYKDTEIYDANIANRPAAASPQMCGDELCIDTMFEIYSRYDWVRDQKAAEGDDNWPGEIIDDELVMPGDWLVDNCGPMALTADWLEARTNGKSCGFVTHKVEDLKPSQKGDVIWGFDPYRYDFDSIKEAIDWVLGEHFGLVIN